jgi:hypothetical protein
VWHGTWLLRCWDRCAKLAEVYGAYIWAFLLLPLALAFLLRHKDEETAETQSAE